MLDELITRAVEARASDVHIEPKPDRVRVRYRIDGVMVDQTPLPLRVAQPLVSRAKVLARMDIAERRQPQDGTFELPNASGGRVAVRASTFPSVLGEKIVLRLLLGGKLMPLVELGLIPRQVQVMHRLAGRTGGMFVVTGPTGSGKTSTLYALLSQVDTQRRNVVTLEDPIEVQIPEITQGQVHNRAGFTFANGLRSILRQDPDVILVGEVRDNETASIAVQASLTGHLVLTTLHTNSTIETITRLVDIGLEPYVVANSLAAVMAQRLVRQVCPRCSEPYTLEQDTTPEVGFALPLGARLVRSRGCPHCMGTGYRGRTGLFELVEIDDRLRTMIKARAGSPDLKAVLREMNIPTLRRMGMHLALNGRTTVDEVVRVT